MSIDELKKALNKAKKLTITVRARPNAAASRIVGFLADDSLKVALKAPPEEGKANRELQRLLAKELAVPAEAIKIVSGAAGRFKLVKITLD
ncbi:MAG: DUF167 domain-containing protein [Candidatus Falkowbacteria bacterium]